MKAEGEVSNKIKFYQII